MASQPGYRGRPREDHQRGLTGAVAEPAVFDPAAPLPPVVEDVPPVVVPPVDPSPVVEDVPPGAWVVICEPGGAVTVMVMVICCVA
jgi:hypothetical protein